jgi:hypothetical protein
MRQIHQVWTMQTLLDSLGASRYKWSWKAMLIFFISLLSVELAVDHADPSIITSWWIFVVTRPECRL